VLQRVLYLAFRTTIEASFNGIMIDGGAAGRVRAFVRILQYLCDQPEEKAVLCLKAGNCAMPCSNCTVAAVDAVFPAARRAESRHVVHTLNPQLESAAHLRYGRQAVRRKRLEDANSFNSFVPALAGMAGLGTEPFLFYKMIGFDALHVRSFLLVLFFALIVLRCCTVTLCLVFAGAEPHLTPGFSVRPCCFICSFSVLLYGSWRRCSTWALPRCSPAGSCSYFHTCASVAGLSAAAWQQQSGPCTAASRSSAAAARPGRSDQGTPRLALFLLAEGCVFLLVGAIFVVLTEHTSGFYLVSLCYSIPGCVPLVHRR